MIRKTTLGLAVAALFVAGIAQARPAKPVTPVVEATVDGSGLSTAGSFSQSFDLVAAAAGSYTITVGGIASLFGNNNSNLSFTFDGVTKGASVVAGNIAGTSNFSGLTVGQHYTLLVSGLTTAPSAIYTVNSIGFTSIKATAPIPEPESYAMLLAGLGLMATIARRRRGTQA